MDDLHWHSVAHRPQQLQALRLSDMIVSTYAYNVLAFYPELASQVPARPIVWVPHASPPGMLRPIEAQPPRRKILLSGCAAGVESTERLNMERAGGQICCWRHRRLPLSP